ncbi:Amylopullulanase [termite gut metagenome]|uniref:Amylopullulanase n=1 Tax=termite gut metagenome TaxID=433724 RepID=A0A5J4S403_9ZZZZ
MNKYKFTVFLLAIASCFCVQAQHTDLVVLDGRETDNGNLMFNIKVNPLFQNYFTLKFWGSDRSNEVNVVWIDGKQIGYQRHGDYAPINRGYSNPLPDRFYYSTIMLPLSTTKGKESVKITIQSLGGRESEKRKFYQAYSHINPYIDFSNEKQGESNIRNKTAILAEDIPESEKQKLMRLYRQKQIEDFNTFSIRLDKNPDEKISIEKYKDDLRFYASVLVQPWSPAQTNVEKAKALSHIFQVIDNYVKDYYADTRLVVHGGHQGDWGGFLSALGDVLYIVEAFIWDESILGKSAFNRFLNESFVTNTVECEFSLAGVDWKGNELNRKEAWERALKANFDFARARLSYIYNQVYYTYEGAWKAHEGLRIIGSEFYEGKTRSHQILRTALGISPFLGEEVLLSADGRELDLYHSLFYHDRQAFFTDDFLQIVAKGKAKSKLDASGNIVRRLPYGKHYTGITSAGLTRENGYVGNYGETPNYLPEWFYRTLNHPGDEALNDDILKLALLNLHARSFTRYTSLDDKGKRIMRMQQVLDERNDAYPGMYAYATRVSTAKSMHYASLEQYMAVHPDRYSSPQWGKYWDYAAEAVGFAQQQLVDRQFFQRNYRAGILNVSKYDFFLPETYEYITSKRAEYNRFKQMEAGKVHPLTDFDYYTQDEINKMKVRPSDYKQFAWVDIDNIMVCMKDETTVISGVFNMLNRAFAGNGKIHAQYKNYDQIVQIATRAKFQYQDYYLRMNSPDVDFMTDINYIFRSVPLALSGEICPITYQPGVGKIIRENFEVDNPYSAYPDYLEAQYGAYLFVFNTTRPEYGNEQTFEVELPEAYKKNQILDMVSGKMLSIKKGKIIIPPYSAFVLKLDKDFYVNTKPYPVDFVTALAGNNRAAINWKPASGAKSYILKRSLEENGNYEIIARDIENDHFVDENAKNGISLYYKVVAVNNKEQSWDSYRAKVELNNPTIQLNTSSRWRDDKIGINRGTARVEDAKISINTDDGKGLGEGDDYMISSRNIEDSFLFVNTLIYGDTEISAKLIPGNCQMSGLMLRDRLSTDTRYIFLGCDKFGNILFQNRTKDSRREYTNHKISPFTYPVITQTIAQYPWLKLVRNAGNHLITGYMSKDGQNWEKIADLFTPFPGSVYAGVGAANAPNAVFEEVSVK